MAVQETDLADQVVGVLDVRVIGTLEELGQAIEGLADLFGGVDNGCEPTLVVFAEPFGPKHLGCLLKKLGEEIRDVSCPVGPDYLSCS